MSYSNVIIKCDELEDNPIRDEDDMECAIDFIVNACIEKSIYGHMDSVISLASLTVEHGIETEFQKFLGSVNTHSIQSFDRDTAIRLKRAMINGGGYEVTYRGNGNIHLLVEN